MKSLLFILLSAAVALADPHAFQLTATTAANGGGPSVSIGGRFSLTGTAGQPEAAPPLTSSCGCYRLAPGFWHAVTLVRQPGAPLLTSRLLSPQSLLLAWPVNDGGCLLEQSPDMSEGSWQLLELPVTDTAFEHTVTIPMTDGRMFFRLTRP